jgi:hypothetical protein
MGGKKSDGDTPLPEIVFRRPATSGGDNPVTIPAAAARFTGM